MSIFKNVTRAIGEEIQDGIDSAKRRVQGEIGSTVNRINKFLYPGTLGAARLINGKEPLYYPLEASYSDDPRSDRTNYWLKVEINEQKTAQVAESLGVANTDFIANKNVGITDRVIWLYLPQMQQTDSMAYEGKEIGFLGRSAAAAIGTAEAGGIVQSLVSAGKTEIDQLTSTVEDVVTGKTPSIGSIAAGVGIAKSIPGVNKAGNAISFATGIAKDPHTISLFQGVDLRGHTFEFNMVPESEREAEQVSKIVQVFREAMYPISVNAGEAFRGATGEDIDNAGINENNSSVDIAYIFPNTFKLTAYRLDPETGDLVDLSEKGLFYKECVLKSAAVDFDQANDLAIRPGGHFTSTKLTLEFQEVETLKRRDIQDAYRKGS